MCSGEKLLLLCLVTFIYGFILDILQITYTAAIIKNRSIAAANISVIYYAVAAGAAISIIKNKWLFLPYLIGVWLGSFMGMWLKKRQEKN